MHGSAVLPLNLVRSMMREKTWREDGSRELVQSMAANEARLPEDRAGTISDRSDSIMSFIRDTIRDAKGTRR